MPGAFKDKKLASEAGKKSKRGPSNYHTPLAEYIKGEGAEKARRILAELDGAEYLALYERLKQYYIPKKRAIDSRVSVENLSNETIDELWKRITEGE